MNGIQKTAPKGSFPWYGYLGLILMMIFWYLNWSLVGLRTHLLFFPLWLGYCLFIDALVRNRKGSSLISRSLKRYFGLFLISIPVWWFFELINTRSGNWQYLGREYFSDLEYFLYASLCFSTVIPAVFGTAELTGSFIKQNAFSNAPRIPAGRKGSIIFLIIGMATLALLMIWPGYFYPFVWISVYLLLDGINEMSGFRNLLHYANLRNWRPMVSLAIGCLITGFFWEMWNYYAYPKWIYHTPGVEFLYVFEMPLLGYLGYIPFSFELFAFYHLVSRIGKKKDEGGYYVQL